MENSSKFWPSPKEQPVKYEVSSISPSIKVMLHKQISTDCPN